MYLCEDMSKLDNLAIVDAFDNQMTYRDLEKMSEEYSKLIPGRSVVIILCDYAIETVAFYYCMMNLHIVPILVDKHLDQDLLERLIKVYNPQFLWKLTSQAVGDNCEKLFSEIYYKRDHSLVKLNNIQYELNEELALLITTSGSTGSPKLVRLSYTNIEFGIDEFIKVIMLDSNDRGITTIPMNHVYGANFFHMHWRKGATVYITDWTLLSKEYWSFFEKEKITNLCGVPFVYDILLQIGFFNRDFKYLKFLTEAGGKLGEDKQKRIVKRLKEKGIKFYICYGQTEGAGGLSILSDEYVDTKIGSIGLCHEGMDMYLDYQLGKELGELVFKGKMVSLGYAYSYQDLKLGDENQGVLHTGDIAYIDDDGFIFLKGRLKRFVKILGVRMSLDEVENLLREQFPDNEFACVGQDDFIHVYYTGNIASCERIASFCCKKLSLHKQMLCVEYIETVPRNQTGKILYKELKI